MTKRLVTLCGAIALLVCACNESGQFSEYYKACTPESFSPTCPTSKAYTVCIDNRVVALSCAENEVCAQGICRVKSADDCSPDSYVSACADDNHKYICNAQHQVAQELCPDGTICNGGSCVPDDSCVAEGFVSTCTDDSHYTVCRDSKIASEACGSDTVCVADGVCAEPCNEEDINHVKYICSLTNSADGDVYISTSYLCTQKDDKYYWKEDTSETCGNGCSSEQKCEPVDPSECDASFVAKCEENKLVTCNNRKIETKDCGTRACYVKDNISGCFELSDFGSADYSYAYCSDDDTLLRTTDVPTDNNMYIIVEEFIDCPHGCNPTTGRCKLTEKEGTPCDHNKDGSMNCEDNLLYSCDRSNLYLNNPYYGMNVWFVQDCTTEFDSFNAPPATEGVCVSDGPLYGWCKPRCTAADVDAPVSQCGEVLGEVYQEGWMCIKQDEDYYWANVGLECSHGCNDDNTACRKLHPDEHKKCDAEGKTKCGSETIMLTCDYTYYFTYMLTYSAYDCSAMEQVCVESDGKAECVGFCTRAEYEANAVKSLCSDKDERTLLHYQCKQYGENDYRWKIIDHEDCYHGCNVSQKACAKIHEDEGQSCSNMESDEDYYARRCDGPIHLTCESGEVVARSCLSELCHDSLGCYAPCETIGEVNYTCSADTDGEVTYGYDLLSFTCVEDPIYHIKYWGDWDYVEYCDGATSCTEGKDSCY